MDALGHINPILSIVKELRRRNYRAIILTTRPLNSADQLRAQGFELDHCEQNAPGEGDNDGGSQLAATSQTSDQVLSEIMRPLIGKFRLGVPDAYSATYRIDGAVGKHLTDMIENHDIIEAKFRSLEPNLVVYDHVIGIPCATTVASCWVRVYSGFPTALYSSLNDNFCAGLGLRQDEMGQKWKQFEHSCKGPLRQRIREFWREKRCPDWPLELDLTPTSSHLNFYLGPQELGLEKIAHLKALPEVWYRLEHTIDDDGDNVDPTRTFEIPQQIAGQPGKLIYFSLGTLVTCDTQLINRLLEILSKSPNRFIVSMGQMFKQVKLHPNMWGDKFIDQRAVLKKADLFITHGGHNSIIEAFYYGVPGLIVLPVFADQFDSAQRVQDCGFGFRLNPFNCTQDELLNAIDSVLTNDKLRENMLAIGARMRSTKYHMIAADKLEQLIIEGSDGALSS